MQRGLIGVLVVAGIMAVTTGCGGSGSGGTQALVAHGHVLAGATDGGGAEDQFENLVHPARAEKEIRANLGKPCDVGNSRFFVIGNDPGGADVVVTDAHGVTVGIGKVSRKAVVTTGKAADGAVTTVMCSYPVTITGIQSNSQFFTVKVGSSKRQFTRAQLASFTLSY